MYLEANGYDTTRMGLGQGSDVALVTEDVMAEDGKVRFSEEGRSR